MKCPWCSGTMCEGNQQRQPHHSLCCMDRNPAPCWGTRGGVEDDRPFEEQQ